MRDIFKRKFAKILRKKYYTFFSFSINFKMKGDEEGKPIKPYIIRVNVPGHVTIGYQLTIHVTAYFTVSPPVVDVYNAYHVPLERHKKSVHRSKVCVIKQS